MGMWAWAKKNGEYVRTCQACRGTGEEVMGTHRCRCPFESVTVVEHPANYRPEYGGIGYELVRCDVCRTVWLRYFECGDDSWDVPAPELIGMNVPADDWRVNRGAK